MLAQAGNRVHAGAEGAIGCRWKQRWQVTLRTSHLHPALACLELGMLPDGMHVVDLGIGDGRSVKSSDNLCRAEPGKGLHNNFSQLHAVSRALSVGAETLVVQQFWLLKHAMTK